MSLMVKARIKNVFFPGQDASVLSDIKLDIEKGEFVVVSGPVAAGKSTLCHCLTGAIPHYYNARLEGQIVIADKDLALKRLPEMAGITGYVMQDPQSQIFSVSLREDVAFGPGNLGLPLAEIEERVAEALSFVGLTGYEERAPETLSGGEAQRAVLAGVLALHPNLLVLDHPAAELDAAGRKAIHSRLGKLNKSKGTTIVMVTESPEELIGLATRFLVLEEGKIVADSPRCPEVSHFSEKKMSDMSQNVNLQRASSIEAIKKGRDKTVELLNCTYTYSGGQRGCINANLSLHKGELVALMGINGSGKTTLAKHINGLLSPQSGDVEVLGHRLDKVGQSMVLPRVGFLFQNPDFQIFAETVEEEVAFGLKVRGYPPADISQRVKVILEELELLSFKNLHPHRLSRSQRQLLALASVLVCKPDIIIADEPTAGLHKSAGYKIMECLSDFAFKGGTVLVVTHDLELAVTYAHRIVAMYRNQIHLDLPVTQLSKHLPGLREIGLDFMDVVEVHEMKVL